MLNPNVSGIATAKDAFYLSSRSGSPTAAKTGLDSKGHMHIHKSDRCPLCAMFPARYPEFSCALKLTDNRTYYFCSPRCLLRVWGEPTRFLKVSKDKITHIIVRHYFTGEQMDGKTALWVSGSNVIGPMGPALVPLKTHSEVATFKKRHGAKQVFRLMELTSNDWRKILGNP
ncbi:MAG: nitrous oxide reductase accessory protein NosL [Desulfobacteraceae bacterium]|jgi:nitrous oxide reductase accessory protein NosL